MVTTGYNEPVDEGVHFVATAIKNESSECSIKNVHYKKQDNPDKESISISINIPPLLLILLAPEAAPAASDGVPTQNRGRCFPAI